MAVVELNPELRLSVLFIFVEINLAAHLYLSAITVDFSPPSSSPVSSRKSFEILVHALDPCNPTYNNSLLTRHSA